MIQISETDRSIIKNMMLTKPYKEIAFLIDRPVSDVESVVAELNKESGLVTWQEKHNAKRPPAKLKAEKEKRQVQARTKKDKKLLNLRERQRVDRERRKAHREVDEHFQTRKIDYSKKVMIKIDRTTFIYSDPGQEKQTRDEFMKLYRRPLEIVK